MQLTDFYPTPAEMIGNEMETVKFFTQNPYIQEHVHFYTEASRVYGQMAGNSRGFSFGSHFDFQHPGLPGFRRLRNRDKPNVRVIIAALVEQTNAVTYGNISYVFAVCRLQSKRNAILRKFHFDITVSGGSRQPHPISHLQYCGEMIDVMESLGYRRSQLQQLHTKVREPRIFFSPMSLALLVDMAGREFGSETFRVKFLRSPEWLNLIRDNERLILKPYYERCAEIINDNARSRPTILDEFYKS